MSWHIVAKPEGRYLPRKGEQTEDENRSAMIVQLRNDAGVVQEVSRVGFVRRNTKHPDVDYITQLAAEVGKARASVDLLNDMLAPPGENT